MPTLSLQSIPLNKLDQINQSAYADSYSDGPGGNDNNSLVLTVNNGWNMQDTLDVVLDGKQAYVTYNVFLLKIRRESDGLSEAAPPCRVAWLKMAQAFLDEFGHRKVPTDVIRCLRDIRKFTRA